MCIGPKQIYLSANRVEEFCAILKENGPQAVEKFKQFSQMDSGGEFSNGMSMRCNMLMYAAAQANEYIVKYIVENADPKILDMYDCENYSALNHTVRTFREYDCENYSASYHAVRTFSEIDNDIIACARILLQTGADTTMGRSGKKESPGEDPLGYIVRIRDTYGNHSAHPLAARMESLCELFVASGVKNACSFAYDESKNPVGLFSINENPAVQTSLLKASFVERLQEARIKTLNNNWSKIRLVSLLSTIPNDLKGLIIEKIICTQTATS